MKRPQIFKTIKGVTVKVSPTEIKQTIMRAHGWTSEEYTKARDIFKNRLKNYESFRRAQGINEAPQSPVELLYKQARTMIREKSNYKMSAKMRQIESFTAVSISEGRRASERQGLAFKRQNLRQTQYVESRFEGLLRQNKGAQEIVERFKKEASEKGELLNASKLEKALSDYANALHDKMSYSGSGSGEAIPTGEGFGSDGSVDFDIEEYL